MSGLTIIKARTYEEAGRLAHAGDYSLPVLKAGGMDVIDHMKEGLLEPDALINIRGLRSDEGSKIRLEGRRLRIDAAATLAEIGASDLLREKAPGLSEAAMSAATPQVRNVATAGGNLLQRPRCWYYRNDQFNCLKKGGATCFAVEGENKFHAIFGDGPCHIVHPSSIAPALMTMNTTVHVVGGDRTEIGLADLYHGPDRGVRSEHTLEPGEVVTHLTCDAAPHSGFAVVKEKQSFDWPLAFAVASVVVRDRKFVSANICAGAVAPTPWSLQRVSAALAGVSIDDTESITRVCNRAINGAEPMTQNSYKLKLLPVVVRRAVLNAAGRGGAS